MLKSWKTRALATVGAATLAAPFALMGGATAVPGGAQVTSANSATGNIEAGSVLNVNGTGCIQNGTIVQTVTLRLSGPSPATTAVSSGSATVTAPSTGDFTGTISVPAGARVGDSFTLSAFCTESGVPGQSGTFGTPIVVAQPSVLPPVVTIPPVLGVTSGSNPTATIPPSATTPAATSGVAVPITATPPYTG